MLKRLTEIENMEKEDKNHILHAIDGLIKSVKLKNIAASQYKKPCLVGLFSTILLIYFL